MGRAAMLLVEDDVALAELLVWHFEREDFVVTRTADGEEALLLARERVPDIVLLDWMVEGLSGIEVCRRLRRRAETANVPIIMLTARGEEEDRVRGLETGADDYVTKPFSPRELVARVRAVLRRFERPSSPEILRFGDVELDGGAMQMRLRGEVVTMTATEFRLLDYLARHPGRVFSRDQLLDAIWGDARFVTPRSVDVYVRRIREKMEEDAENPRFLKTMRGAGYRFERGTA